jgi:hypothetical protein
VGAYPRGGRQGEALGRVRLRPNRGFPAVLPLGYNPGTDTSILVFPVLHCGYRDLFGRLTFGVTSQGETPGKPRFGRSLTLPDPRANPTIKDRSRRSAKDSRRSRTITRTSTSTMREKPATLSYADTPHADTFPPPLRRHVPAPARRYVIPLPDDPEIAWDNLNNPVEGGSKNRLIRRGHLRGHDH